VTPIRPGAAVIPFAVPEVVQLVDSTNRYLADLVRAGLADGSQVPEGYAVVADYQSQGRGRLERRWEAPVSSAVLCSLVFRPGLAFEELHLTAWAVALAAVQACREIAGIELSLKWPNDLMALKEKSGQGGPLARAGGEQKVAGILSEIVRSVGTTGPRSEQLDKQSAVVVGIGINVNWPPGWPPEDTEDPELASIAARGTALNRLAGLEVDRCALIGSLLVCTGAMNAKVATKQGRRELASLYRLACSTVGREVKVELANEAVVGTALDVDDAGRLLLSTGAGIRTITAGDVVHLR
jgi:BirA family biotin operon repressor/biotin-[acetyl-CoA-carboxylase] ligase